MATGFFLIAVSLFPVAVGPDPVTLARIAPGVLWVAALFAFLLSLDRLFQADYEDGSLDLLLLSAEPLELIVLAKCLAQWLMTGAPLILVAPVLALALNLDVGVYGVLSLALLIGTPALTLIGAVGAALTISVRRGGVLLSLLILPLYLPVLIFGVAAIEAAVLGTSARGHLMLLGSLSLFALVLGPWASAAALRLHLQ